MAMRRIKKNDEVIVITGKDKGKRGVVAQIVDEARVIVANINIALRHTKSNSRGDPGGILKKEMPLHVSNVALFNPQTGKADKVGFKFLADGKKVRIFKSTKEVVDR
jgi:large subunit ribosomal protein L24